MATPAAVIPPSAVPAAGPAPAASSPAGAGQPQSPNERILAAIGADGSQPPAPQQSLQQHAAAATPGAAPVDPIEELLANLPQDHPARARFQSLRTVEGRVKTLSAADQRAAEAERTAAVAAIAAVRRGADPYELAASLGADPAQLIAAAGWQPGQAQPSQAERPQAGQPASPGGEAAPRTFQQRWDDFVDARELGHKQSWSKPFSDGMTQAATLREMADTAIATAAAEGNPAAQAAAEKHAGLLRQQADAAQTEAMMAPLTRLASMVHQSLKALESRVGGFENEIAEARKADQAAAAVDGEWRAIGQAMRASREPNGVATFGPEGYGIFAVDEAGNVTGQPTPEGRKVLEMAHALIGEKQWPRTMDSLTDALDLIASDYVLSEGGAQALAGGTPGGGDATLPGQGLAPGNGAVRPSPSGQAASAPTGMY